MGWRLNYTPDSGKYISTPVINIPTGSSYEIEFQYSFDDSGRARVAGSSNASANNIWIEPSSVSETLTITSSAGAPRNFTLTGLVRSENNTFRIVRTGASTTELFLNGISQGVVSLAGSFAFTRFFITASTTATSAPCELTYFKVSVNGSLIVNYDATASGGTGDILPELISAQNGTQIGTWPSNDAEWVFYSSGGGDSFTGTIGKTSLSILTKSLSTQSGLVIDGGKSSNTLSNKTLDVSSGYSSTVDKSTSTISQRQFSVSVGTVLGVGKQTLVLSNKQESTQLGYINTLSKLGYTLSTKQLAVVVGANLPFIGVLNKTTYSLLGKQLSNSLGWNSGVAKQSLFVDGKQESTNLGYSSLLQKLVVTLNSKPLSVQVGTAIPFIGLLNKLQLNAVGKPLSVSAGTSIPFLGLIDKTSLLLSGKVLDASRGQYIDIVPSHLTLITKLLSIGEVVYPVIPKRRVYGLNDKIRLYIMRR